MKWIIGFIILFPIVAWLFSDKAKELPKTIMYEIYKYLKVLIPILLLVFVLGVIINPTRLDPIITSFSNLADTFKEALDLLRD